MQTPIKKPQVTADTTVKKVIIEISEKMLGVTTVLEKGEIIGVITDGDIRRMLNKHENINNLTAKDIMSLNPKTIHINALAVKALEMMQNNSITQLVAVEGKTYKGIVHLHNLINEGII